MLHSQALSFSSGSEYLAIPHLPKKHNALPQKKEPHRKENLFIREDPVLEQSTSSTSLYVSVAWNTRELSLLMAKLMALFQDDEYDNDFLRPTIYALTRVGRWLIKVNSIILELPSDGYVSTTGDGGLRIEWVKDDKRVHLIVSPDPFGNSYIYHQDNIGYGADKNISPYAIAKWLNWLSK